MSTPLPTPRLYFLTAKEAPIVVVLRRGPSKRYHVIKINTQSAALERGSWFSGRLYTDDCDISFDGEWLVYNALGAGGAVWTGLCREWENVGTWNGGGFFASRTQLQVNVGSKMKVTQAVSLPFTCREDGIEHDPPGKIIRPDPQTARMLREGWRRLAPSQASERPRKKSIFPSTTLANGCVNRRKSIRACAWSVVQIGAEIGQALRLISPIIC